MRIADTAGIATLVFSALGATALIATASWQVDSGERALSPSPVPPPVREPLPRIGRCGVPAAHPVASGSDYRDVLLQARSALETCMAIDRAAEVELRFEISASGAVDTVAVEHRIGHRRSPHLSSCLRRVSNGLVFPVNDHPVTVTTWLHRQRTAPSP